MSNIKCPYCNSLRVQTSRRGFNKKRAFWGGMLTNSWFWAYIAGSSGEDDIVMTCLQCGATFDIYHEERKFIERELTDKNECTLKKSRPRKRVSPIVIIIAIILLLAILAN